MKITEIEVTIDMRVNVGNYETFASPLSLKAVLSEGDTVESATAELYKMAKAEWSKEALKQMSFYQQRRPAKLEESFEKTKELLKKYANE
jgi:hypothetical protein